MHDRSCLGDQANAYSLGRIEIGERATVAQEAYLCTGTHDFADPLLQLQTAPIVIGADSFVGARAFILPGIRIGNGAIVGACSVVTKHVESGTRVAGNPARVTSLPGLEAMLPPIQKDPTMIK
jgi:putative colanic acid biosynthesis acetyltransferase WcaF